MKKRILFFAAMVLLSAAFTSCSFSKKECEHSYSDRVVAATCTEDGYTEHTMFATRYLFDATMTDDGDVYRLDFAGNQAYCSDLIRDLSAFLNLSLEGATSYKDTQASGYLCIDKVTGLPVAMGMYFTRTHMFGEIPYVLSYQLDQTIALSPAE